MNRTARWIGLPLLVALLGGALPAIAPAQDGMTEDPGPVVDGVISADPSVADPAETVAEELPAQPSGASGLAAGGDGANGLSPVVEPVNEADRLLLNGLAAVTLESLAGFRERPLFTPSRRPPFVAAPEPEAPVVFEPEPPPAPVPPPNVRLSGVIQIDGVAVALLLDLDAGVTQRLRVGEQIGAWSVAAIEPAMVRLSLDDRSEEFRLFQPGAVGQPPGGTGMEFTNGPPQMGFGRPGSVGPPGNNRSGGFAPGGFDPGGANSDDFNPQPSPNGRVPPSQDPNNPEVFETDEMIDGMTE